MPEDEVLSEDYEVEAPKSLPARSSLLQSRIAQEIAVGLLTPVEIAEQFHMTNGQLLQILQNEAFRELVRDAKAAWGGGLAAKERTRAKADMMVEDSLLILNDMIHDKSATDVTRLDAIKTTTSMSSHSAKARSAEGEGDSAAKFMLTLNLAGKDDPVVIEASEAIKDE